MCICSHLKYIYITYKLKMHIPQLHGKFTKPGGGFWNIGSLLMLSCLVFICGASADDLLELSCTTNAHCAQFELSNVSRSHCEESRCICTTWNSSLEHVDCQPRDHKLSNIIGGPCPCSQSHAECDSDKQQCYCAPNYIPSEDRRRCLPRSVPLDAHCESDRQCQEMNPFAFCQTGQHRCLCRQEFENHNGKCLHRLATNCTADKDCGNCGSAFCMLGLKKCVCSPNFVQNQKMNKCVPGAAFGATCERSAVCQLLLGAGGQCRENRCGCRVQYYAKKRPETDLTNDLSAEERIMCQPIVAYGSYCRNDSDCQQELLTPSPMRCKMGECHCNNNYKTLDNVECVMISEAIDVAVSRWTWILAILPLVNAYH
ncbi:tenascin [Scaptodrosophila lebanonensis]|uniref:Tenascin n=1 Tax=Drosophila lebanonensis TaxID=7225 RepID=A0A6J2T663_DROLE|nr:tenascin [Scaptodrosophila lebanonensis]